MAAIATSLGDSGAGASIGSDITGELGSVLGAGFDAAASETAEETPAGEAGTEPSPVSEPAEETPAGEAPSALDAQAKPAEAQQQPAPLENLPPGWKVTTDGKSYLVPKTELPRVQSALQFADSVGQFFGSPQEAQVAAQQATDLRTLTNDWVYGTDDAIRSVLNHWAGGNHPDPGARMAFQRSFQKMLSMAPDMLKSINPQAHSQFVSGMGKSLVASLYEKAATTGNQQDFLDAQAVEWGLTGTYQRELPRQDPAAQAQAQFEAQRREFEGRQESALRRDVVAFNQSAVEGAKFQQLDKRIDAHLAPVKDKFNDVAYADLKAGIQRELVDSLMKSEWFTEHRQNFDQLMSDYRLTWRQGSPGQGLQPRVNAYAQDFLSRAARLLPAIAQKRVNATTQARVGQNGKAPAAKAPGAGRAPAGTPQPPSDRRLNSNEWDAEFAKVFR